MPSGDDISSAYRGNGLELQQLSQLIEPIETRYRRLLVPQQPIGSSLGGESAVERAPAYQINTPDSTAAEPEVQQSQSSSAEGGTSSEAHTSDGPPQSNLEAGELEAFKGMSAKDRYEKVQKLVEESEDGEDEKRARQSRAVALVRGWLEHELGSEDPGVIKMLVRKGDEADRDQRHSGMITFVQSSAPDPTASQDTTATGEAALIRTQKPNNLVNIRLMNNHTALVQSEDKTREQLHGHISLEVEVVLPDYQAGASLAETFERNRAFLYMNLLSDIDSHILPKILHHNTQNDFPLVKPGLRADAHTTLTGNSVVTDSDKGFTVSINRVVEIQTNCNRRVNVGESIHGNTGIASSFVETILDAIYMHLSGNLRQSRSSETKIVRNPDGTLSVEVGGQGPGALESAAS